MTAETRARVLQGIARARRWVDLLVRGEVASTAALAEFEGCSERAVRLGLNLAFLSPRLVGAALEGRLPHGVGLTQLTTLPMDWATHRR
jgi:hypothetical protein